MNSTECPRARRVVRVLLAILIATIALAVISCSDPEKTKAEHVRRGEALLKDRKYQEAALEFRNAIQIDDNLAAAHWGLAQVYEKLERFNEAFDELNRAVKLDPSNKEARFKLGTYCLLATRGGNQEMLEEANRHAEELISQDENYINGHILLANVLAARGGPENRARALERLNHAISLDPNRIETHISLAAFHWAGGDIAKAEETFKNVIRQNDRASLARVEYGRFLVQQKRAGEAEEQFRAAVEVDPQNPDVRWVLASFYLVNNRLDRAEEEFRALADLDRGHPEGRAKLADFYAMIGRHDDALNIYQESVRQFPDYARGHYRVGELLLQQGNLDAASAKADEILKKDARQLDALLLRGRIKLMRNQVKESIADLGKILEQEPHSLMALYVMAEAQYRDEQIDAARSHVSELERFHPNFMPAKLMQVELSLAGGDAQQARRQATELLDKLKEIAPTELQTPQLLTEIKAKAFIARGKANTSLRDFAAARSDMEGARDASPNSPVPHVSLAELSLAEGKREEASQHVERALALDGSNFQALSAYIAITAGDGRLDQARARIEQLISGQPNSAPLHFLLAQAYRVGNNAQPPDWARAEAALRRAIELDPDYIAAYAMLANFYFDLSEIAAAENRGDDAARLLDQSVAEYRKIVERRPDNAVAFRNIGMIESKRQNLDAAEQHYRSALAARPDEPISANNLAALYGDHGRGNGDEAMRLAQEVVRRYPNEPGFADTLGWVYYRSGLYQAAVEQLKRAVDGAAKIGGDNSLYRYHLGAALAAKGDKAAARRELQKSIQLAEQEHQRGRRQLASQTTLEDARRALESL